MADDDLFASLGGTLMRDILADLQVDEDGSNWLSLEQLEQELSKLDAPNPDFMFPAVPQEHHTPLSAASLVVQNAPQPPAAPQHAAPPFQPPPPPVDSWSASMQRFAQSSLEQDFLQADSARKHASAMKPPPGLDWSSAEEYDTTAPYVSRPPPGISSNAAAAAAAATTATIGSSESSVAAQDEKSPQQLLTEAADRLRRQLQLGGVSDSSLEAGATSSRPRPAVPAARPPPMTPQNSVSMIFPPPTPPPSAAATPAQPRAIVAASASVSVSLPAMPEHGPAAGSMKGPAPPPPQPPVVGMAMHGAPPIHPTQMPPTGIPMGVPAVGMPMPFPPHQGGGAGAPIPIASRPPAWQVPPPGPHSHAPPMMQHLMPPPPPPPPPPVKMYCNPHPRAPPVPATAIASHHMSPRDISYVVHSMMKPLLSAGVSPYDYDVQYFLRKSGVAAVTPVGDGDPGRKQDDGWVDQIVSRHAKSKEWSTSHSVLGHVAKSNVARPRALISTAAASVVPDESDGASAGEHRQRASLWRSRIYCDQAYQAYFAVLANWRGEKSATSTEVQTQYRKLFKCLGIAPAGTPGTADGKENAYQVTDKAPLQRLLKLEKGRVLVARIVEQAVLPPAAMQALLPALLEALLSTMPPAPSTKGAASQQAIDDRLFLALARVIQTLPTLDTLLGCMKASSQPAALASTTRMQCVHSLLQRGSAEKARMSPSDQEQWSAAETDFLNFLSGS